MKTTEKLELLAPESLQPSGKNPRRHTARQIRSSTRKGDIVLDPFCGSGTSILAAESYGRRCFAMELDPQYCAVIIQRWEEKTGQKAVLLEGGAANVRDETAD